MRSAARAIDCSPEEQKRLIVIAEQPTGSPGAKAGNARNVHSLLRLGHRATEDYVVNLLRVERLNAGKSALDRRRRQIVGASGGERSPTRFSDRSAD